MNKSDRIFDIFITKLNSIMNPKFQNVFIKSMFFVGLLLITPKFFNILAKLELITHDFILKLEFLESSETTLSIIGFVLILISSWLFYNERRMNHEITMLQEAQDVDLLVNYYVCESYEKLVEINNGDMSSFPVKEAMVLRNPVMHSLNKIISNHPDSYRHASFYGNSYKSVENYLVKYPEASIPDRSDGNFSYFQVVRTPSKAELNNLKDNDGLLKVMLDDDVNFPIAMVGGYEDGCTGIDLQEEFIFRKLWCAFISITNNSEKVLQLDSLNGKHTKNTSFHSFGSVTAQEQNIEIPKVMLKPRQSMVVPLAILIPPLYSFKRKELSPSTGGGDGERVQIVKNESIYLKNIEDCIVYGDRFDIKNITYKKGKNLIGTSIREFDLTNMFTYDLHWQCGSCPHLFIVNENITYIRELLAHCQNSFGTDYFIVPEGAKEVIIAEIEDETTFIKSIIMNSKVIANDLVLNKGQHFRFFTEAGSKITATGYYTPDSQSIQNIPQGIKRNELVGGFLRQFKLEKGLTKFSSECKASLN